MARKFSEWNYFNKNVQQGMTEGKYVNAAFTLLAAGPARLSAATTNNVTTNRNVLTDADFIFPIGIIQQFNLGQQSSVMRLFEIGSERSYMMRGRTVGTLGLGRIMYHGPSLLRVLYASASGKIKNDSDTFGGEEFNNLITGTQDGFSGMNMYVNGADGGIKDRYQKAPGEPNGNLWLDLSSDIFNQPIGLALFMKDSNADLVGAFYFEQCMVTNHGFGTDAGGTIMTENTSITYERMVPLDTQSLDIMYDENVFTNTTTVGSAV